LQIWYTLGVKREKNMAKTRKNLIFIAFFVFLGMAFFCQAYTYAETVVYKSALVWRADGSGDYALSAELGSIIASKEAILTDGQITSITASWKFKGQVRLEVSANGGGDYTSVINGVPQTSGFKKGSSLKWRARLGEDSSLSKVKITYKDTLGMQGCFGEPALARFKYRKPIYIRNPNDQDLFNYQVNIKVALLDTADKYDTHCEGKIKSDFTDIRFTSADGLTLLPYWREEIGTSASSKIASFWVKIPQLPQDNAKIYVYYNNNSAPDLSNPQDVFDFFDDFSSRNLDLEKWQVFPHAKGSYSIVDSQLKLDSVKVLSKNYQIKDGVIEYEAKSVKGYYETRLIIRGEKEPPVTGDRSQIAYSSGYDGAQHCISIGEIVEVNDDKPVMPNTTYNYRVGASGASLLFERYGSADGKIRYQEDDKEAAVEFEDREGLRSGCIGLEAGLGNENYYDWIRVRKFAEYEPTVDITRAIVEERVSTAVFNNTEISGNGNLVLRDGAVSGTYLSEEIAAAFPIRVIIPKWKQIVSGDGQIAMDISADKGGVYRKDCEQGQFYYASLEDFTMGSDLMFRAVFSRNRKSSESAQLEQISFDVRRGKILVITPNGGEQWVSGTEETIMWSASNYERDYKMNLEYSLDSGRTYEILAENVPNSGEFLWRIPKDISLTDEAKIRVSDANCKERCEDIVDETDKVFRLVEVIEEEVEENTRSWDDLEAETETGFDETSEVVIEDAVTIVTEGDIKFKKLILGDGTGEKKTRLVLNHNIDSASGDIVIRKGGELVQTNKETQEIAGDLIIEEGGILTHKANEEAELYQINITARDIVLEQGGLITAEGKGFTGGEVRESGKGKSGGKYGYDETMQEAFACGGSHAAMGGGVKKYKEGEHSVENFLYGEYRQPETSGSGGAGSWEVLGGSGGGIIKLQARNEFLLSGVITASGQDGGVSKENNYDGAGGAGGSIQLIAETFSGEVSEIIACGGAGHKSAGGGSGGRIYIKGGGKLKSRIDVVGGSGIYNGETGSLMFD
jgi:hypothetical protein